MGWLHEVIIFNRPGYLLLQNFWLEEMIALLFFVSHLRTFSVISCEKILIKKNKVLSLSSFDLQLDTKGTY